MTEQLITNKGSIAASLKGREALAAVLAGSTKRAIKN